MFRSARPSGEVEPITLVIGFGVDQIGQPKQQPKSVMGWTMDATGRNIYVP